jgi:phytoene synthase
MPDLQDAFSYCAELVRTSDRDRFLATLFAPAPARDDLYALHAFNVEVARTRDLAREAIPGEIRLQWWREVLEGRRQDEARASPIAAALLNVIEKHHLPVNALLQLVEAYRFDLYNEPMHTIVQLEDYGTDTSSALIDLAAHILGAAAGAAARPAGVAHCFTDVLITLPKHAARRQLYFPLELLARHGAGPPDVFIGSPSPALNKAVANLCSLARLHLAEAAGMMPNVPQQVWPAFLPVALVRPTLARLERSDVFAPPILSRWRRQWLMWRAARKPNPLAS